MPPTLKKWGRFRLFRVCVCVRVLGHGDIILKFHVWIPLLVYPLLMSYMVQGLVFLNELLLKYDYFCRYTTILENHTMDYHGDPTILHNPNVFI